MRSKYAENAIPRGTLAVQEPNLEPLLGLLQGLSSLWMYLSSFHLPIPNFLCLAMFFSCACLINIIFCIASATSTNTPRYLQPCLLYCWLSVISPT